MKGSEVMNDSSDWTRISVRCLKSGLQTLQQKQSFKLSAQRILQPPSHLSVPWEGEICSYHQS